MSRPWTIVSISKKSGATEKRQLISGFDQADIMSTFKESYPGEDIIALIPGEVPVTTFQTTSPRATVAVLGGKRVDPFELPSDNSS